MELRPVHLVAFAGPNIVMLAVGTWLDGNWKWFATTLVGIAITGAFALFLRQRVKRGADQAIANGIVTAGDGTSQPSQVPLGEGKPRHDADDKLAQAELQKRLKLAVRTIRDSHLGESRGRAALYDLPWYMLIGHSAAGKSTAVTRAGLRFPLGEDYGRAVTGTNGTRDCDWYFTADGILLDTAGRYSQSRSDHGQWKAFLDMLRKNRPRAPINGAIVTASLAHLLSQSEHDERPDAIERHAADLRQRIHEVTERLQVTVPVYVIFTMADRIGGFSEFFSSMDANERGRVWGATLPFEADGTTNPTGLFDEHFDGLVTGLRSHARTQMALSPEAIPRALLTMPSEFASLKPLLSRFVDTLFEDNPFHFRSVFRGFYFTSAEQHGATESDLTRSIAARFALKPRASSETSGNITKLEPEPPISGNCHAYFLHDLFRQVIFADSKLVRRVHTRSRRRRRTGLAVVGCLGIGLLLAVFASAYRTNQQLIRNVAADFVEVKRLQADHIDLKSRLDAMLVLQDRLQQLIAYRDRAPVAYWPLYSGDALLNAVRREYFAGMRQLMVTPVSAEMETYLAQVVAQGGKAASPAPAPDTTTAQTPYQATSATDKGEAYKTLKAYLMLTDAHRAESAHLAAQLTLFWRQWLELHRGSMSREELVERAEKLLSLHVTLAAEPGWPSIQPRAALVDDTRRLLAEAMQGVPARDRVFAEIVARASARYPATTVREIVGGSGDSTLTGSYAIPGAYSTAAWNGYVKQAIGDASRKALDTTDWVLQDAHVDDLTLSGSPEHIRKDLQALYASNYIEEWQRFLSGIGTAEFADFGQAVAAMERLGDTEQSPLRKLLERARVETGWDKSPIGKVAAVRDTGDVLGLGDKAPVPADLNAAVASDGPVSRAFAGLARMVDARDGAEPPLRAYLAALGRLRTRLHGIENEGEIGPGARRLVEATLQGKASELVDALRITDDHMLVGLTDEQRRALRPLLLRPLMQTFASLMPHVENELNRVWSAQVFEPFRKDLIRKFPFDEEGHVEANAEEMGAVFGPSGAIARFANEALGPMVERRGDVLTPRQWGESSIALAPTVLADFAQWVAPLGSTVTGPQTFFQLMPEPTPGGVAEYTVTIGSQSLRYRNEPPQWSNFAWGGTSTAPIVVIEATTRDGRIVRIADLQGADALGELVRTADRKRADDGTHILNWSREGLTVGMRLKIVSTAQVDADGARKRGLRGVQLPAMVAGKASSVATTEGAP